MRYGLTNSTIREDLIPLYEDSSKYWKEQEKVVKSYCAKHKYKFVKNGNNEFKNKGIVVRWYVSQD